MKKSIIFLPAIALLFSCNNDIEDTLVGETSVPSIWQHFHMVDLHNLQKSTKSVTINQDNGFYNVDPCVINFDQQGKIEKFRIGGAIMLDRREDEIDSFLHSGFSNLAEYTYEYNGDAQLLNVSVNDEGYLYGYDFTYSQHGKYIPAIFPVGNLPIYLIKNLSQITTKDDTSSNIETYIYNEQTQVATYKRTHAWLGREIEINFIYGSSPYPLEKQVKVTQRGETILQGKCEYTFDSNGNLLEEYTSLSDVMNQSNITKIKFSKDYLLEITSIEKEGKIYNYERDSQRRLVSISILENGIPVDIEETITYTEHNDVDDWTKAVLILNNEVNSNHFFDEVTTTREILYW